MKLTRKNNPYRVSCVLVGLIVFVSLACFAQTAQAVDIHLNTIRYQTITGWEATIAAMVRDYYAADPYMSQVLNLAVNDLGVTRVRLSVHSGFENPVNHQTDYLNGVISEGTFIQNYAYNIVNDNSDPNALNLAGFQFAILDWQIDHIVRPMRQLTIARGEKFYINVNYVDFGTSSFEHFNNPQEYAEFMLAVFTHMQTKYG